MSAPRLVQAAQPGALLDALAAAGTGRVLLLGPGQTPKPGALEGLAKAGEGPCRVLASPHPDLPLDAFGAWLLASGRPPFGPGRPQDASVWGLLGPADLFAESLRFALDAAAPGGDWQPAFLAHCRRKGLDFPALADAALFQHALPSLDEALRLESARARAWSALGRAGLCPWSLDPPAPGPAAEVPDEWRDLALRLGSVPLRPLQGTQISGLGAADLLGALTKAVMGHALDLAFSEGWRSSDPPPAPASIARPLRRVAVVHPAYGGSLNLAVRSAEALERLGYEVVRVDPSRRAQEVMAAQSQGRSPEGLFRSLEQECLAGIAASKAQFLWILAQAPLSAGALRSLRRQGMLTAFWFCEDHRVRPTWREVAPSVDAFFPMQGGAFQGALRALGAPVLAPLAACAASEACLLDPKEETRTLSFFGAPYANRVRFFESLADLPLELHGEGWDRQAGPLLGPLVRDPSRLSEAQGFELFRTSSINLNLHSSPSLHGIDPDGDYVNPRTFEIAACGGFQLCDRRRDLPSAFQEGEEIIAFSSVAELREKLDRWLRDPVGRRRVAAAARRRILAEHTYEHRLATALRTLGLAQTAHPAAGDGKGSRVSTV